MTPEIPPPLAELGRRLDHHRATAAHGNVAAEVDGHGNLTGLRLAAGTLRRVHPDVLGREIVFAVAAARAAAAEHRRQAMSAVLPGMAT
ncbi:YbaB/EbfC family nucleoid-associated protein [Amycolatopsis methanolica]|uniref:YbaB/EbfC DNA-binding family protein n=1 Tax=Amycolatopsis methanolica 239 TaxID=1068978 RepID=A0A076MYT5_AMYME|nr:YbaB/EbfC family nucleoid-associated protein [Amycolatopsis methanolica]AIJ23865.1 hypothetical protein AMETH_3773 [Amycolatopsis methanolica 239]